MTPFPSSSKNDMATFASASFRGCPSSSMRRRSCAASRRLPPPS
jgi:hypothetical protein